MTDDWGPQLQTLFKEASEDLDGEVFTTGVLTRTRVRRNRVIAGLGGVVVVLAVCAWLLTVPVFGFVQITTQVLTTTLIDLGEGWLAWMLAPVNNIARLLVVSVKAIRMSWKKLIRAY